MGSLTHYELYRSSGDKRHKKKARQYRALIKHMDRTACPNTAPYAPFLQAEDLSIQTSATQAQVMDAYHRAISAMQGVHWVHMEALVNERAGFYLASIGDATAAETFLDRALHLYRNEWGATAKHQFLRQKTDVLLGRQTSPLLGCMIQLDWRNSSPGEHPTKTPV